MEMEETGGVALAKLAGLKQGLYHPRLPTLRKMNMDTVTHKLPTEHARTTTNCPPEEFTHAVTTLRERSGRLHSLGVINNSLNNQMHSYRPLGHIDAWQRITDKLKAQDGRNSVQEQMIGYIGRYKHPAVTSSWQHVVRKARPHTAKPMPATMYTRYRGTTRPQTALPWRS